MSNEIKIGSVIYKKSNLPMVVDRLTEMGLSENEAKALVFEHKLSEGLRSAELAIEQAADDYHAKFVGSRSAEREARRAQNRLSAKRVLTDDYDTGTELKIADAVSLNAQAKSLSIKLGEPVMKLAEFAKWINDKEPKLTLVAGHIESFRVGGKAGLNKIKSPEKIEPYLVQLRKSAAEKFAELSG